MDQGVVLNNRRWMRTVEISDSDELDHPWSDYDSCFISNPFLEVVYLFHVKKV